MKILIVSFSFPPLNSVASMRPYSFAKAFAEAGHEVTVLTAAKPSNPLDLDLPCDGFEVIEVESPLVTFLFRLLGVNANRPVADEDVPASTKRGLKQVLNKFRIRRGLLLLGRMPDLLDLFIRPTLKATQDRSWDLVLSSYAPRYCHAVAAQLKRSGRADRWIADFRDLWTEHHQFKGLFPFTLIEKRLEAAYLAQADLITTVSEELAAKLQQMSPNTPVQLAPNGFDPDDLANIPAEPIFSDDKIRLVYTGTTYPRWGSFKHFLGALASLVEQEPGIHRHLEIVFAGADVANLQQRSQQLGLQELVRFVGKVSRTDALRMQRDAHVQLFFDPNQHNKGIATGKLYEYISSGTRTWRIGPPTETVATRIFHATNTGDDLGNTEQDIHASILRLLASRKKPALQPNTERINTYRRDVIAAQLLEFADRGKLAVQP